jgi:hypothetical protein
MNRPFLAACVAACLSTAAAASPVVVRLEDAGFVTNANVIQDVVPGFGGIGGTSGYTLDWNPDNDPQKALLNWLDAFSGRAGAYCASGIGCALEITTGPLAFVNLESFFLGGWPNTDRDIAYTVIDLADGSVVASGTPTVSGTTGLVVTVNALSDAGFRIEFGPDGFNGGINDITFLPGVIDPPFGVPSPGALALFGLGLAGLGLARRRA